MTYILNFQEIDKTYLSLAGGKGANLGELTKIAGVQVPEGFCITTDAYQEIIGNSAEIQSLLDQLAVLKADKRSGMNEISAKIRKHIEGLDILQDIMDEITRQLSLLGEQNAYAVRSSATAEDLPTASFAGQQDTYLNVMGKEQILQHISQCWASLFTERAVTYRIQNGFDHRKVQLAVVVQKMVFPQASGIMFTADPVSGNRKIVSIDASFGLGEALVSGIVNADNYKVRNGELIGKKISIKKLAIYASKDGGTKEQEIEQGQQHQQALTDEQIIQLGRIGRKIEKHFGSPQDIEWCLSGDKFYIVQSRPITTLFPIPEAKDQENHLYMSVGHQQMMTDAMKPLGISFWQLTAGRPMFEAGGRLFVDVAQQLVLPASREILLKAMGEHDPLTKDAITTILERGDFIKIEEKDQVVDKSNDSKYTTVFQAPTENDPAIVDELIKQSETSVAALKQNIQTKSETELIDYILEDIQQLKQQLMSPKNIGAIMTTVNTSAWVNEKMKEWLGETNAADTLSQSVSNNITSEMGLSLLDVADAIRPHQDVIDYLQQVNSDNFLKELPKLHGGQEASAAIHAFLNKYGMRCAGEIDITRPRWSEKPSTLIPLILSNIKNFEPGESKRRFEQGRQEALKKEQELLDQLKQLPDDEQYPDNYREKETKRMIGLIRSFSGYREYPKYGWMRHYFVYKQALLKEAERLKQSHVIHEIEDIYYLSVEEFREVVRSHKLDDQLIHLRKQAFKFYEKLSTPRVITSDGEIVAGKYHRENLPARAIVGLAVSSGIVEGRARVILNLENAVLEEGDILVTAFTDPSWTPLFVAIKGLITEVGGLMTHGAVIAREYGLPAVVGVENATQLIKDGQRIRVNGTEGYVEILE